MPKRAVFRLSPCNKARIQALFAAGWSCKKIAATLKISAATAAYWRDREFSEIVGRTAKFGSKSKDPAMKARRAVVQRLVGKTVTKNGKTRPLYCSARAIQTALAREHRVVVSRWTVRRDLRELGFFAVVRKRVPTVYEGDFERRLAFVKASKAIDPLRIVFSDEKIFTCNDCTLRTQWVRDKHDALPRENQRWSDRIMVWAAIGKDFFVWKVIDNERTAANNEDGRRHGVLDADAYKRRVLPLVVPHVKRHGLVFQQDGAKAHTAKKVMGYLRGSVQLLEPWPPRSPDLNPIETLWAIIAPEVAKHFPQSCAELKAAIIDVFNHFLTHRMATINALVASFTDRCVKVRKAHGAY